MTHPRRKRRVEPIVRDLKEEILLTLVPELGAKPVARQRTAIVGRVLLALLVEELKLRLLGKSGQDARGELGGDGSSRAQMTAPPPQDQLEKAESKLSRILTRLPPDDVDEEANAVPSSEYQNPKYKRPKYENVESVLRYVENGDDSKGGVKLVIMNFND